jgi:hypothetical protein
MVTITDYSDDGESIRIGGYPKIADTKPPAEITTSDFTDIKINANSQVKMDTGVHSIEDSNDALGSLKNACAHYAGYLIRLQWEDRGNKIPGILTEYQRIVAGIRGSSPTEIPGIEETAEGFSYTSSYKSSGLNPDVEPFFSRTDPF